LSKKTLAEKYRLKGKPVKISKETKVTVGILTRKSERVIKVGEDYTKTCKKTF